MAAQKTRGGPEVVPPHQRREVFAARFTASFRPLWLIAVSIVHDAGAAEDAVQDAAVIALRKLDELEDAAFAADLTPWLAQIVRNVSLNHRRKTLRRHTLATEPEQLNLLPGHVAPADDETPAVTASGTLAPDQRQFDDQVVAALATVPETARACLLLRTVENMEYSQIARVLGIPEGTAMSHVHRARHALRAKLAATPEPTPHGATPHTP